MQELREDIELDLEVYKVDAIEKSPRRFEGHQRGRAESEPAARGAARLLAGTAAWFATAQPLGTLAVYLLEPRSEDGLATWNFFDSELKAGRRFPGAAAAQAGADLGHDRRAACRKPRAAATDHFRTPGGGGGGRVRGGFAGAPRWLDGEHWLQRPGRPAHEGPRRDRPLAAVRRRQGARQGPGSHPARSTRAAAQSIARQTSFDMDPAKRGFLFEHGQDLYYATFDGSTAVRLTNNPGREQWPQFSPDGKSVAFVRDFDLYAVDIASQTERRLTTGGRDDLRHGHADWVYYEEIFNRRWPAFWWSPDSKQTRLHGV